MNVYMRFGTNDTERMRITSGGNVGIGTSSPSEKLHLYQNASAVELRMENNTISSHIRSSTDNLNFYVSNGEKMRITSGGFVNINNTANVTYRLYVDGTIYATGDITASSDARYKTNIRPIENALAKIVGSRGVIYDRINEESYNNIGFIAQELEVYFPELVSTDNEGFKGVKYQNAVAVLFEAIKEQQKQIEELKTLIDALTK